jgi:S-adenosylmethionine decarboxylase
MHRLKLHGFNNLTKTLSFNIYDICYAHTRKQRREYIEYIDEAYNADRLTDILGDVADIIGATILNTAHQDYDPQGASVTMLISEEPITSEQLSNTEAPGPLPESVVTHLDKSHITVHTYPESHPDNGISTFRADIDVSTCGRISPLKALNYLIHSFESDIVIMDYRVRGFTRDVRGRKHFIDHKIDSIQNYLSRDTRERYQMIDVTVYQENIFHTKMRLKDFDLDNYLFGQTKEDLTTVEKRQIRARVDREMLEIYYGRNLRGR